VIEDAAEALGATYQGRAPGTFGVMGAFSFNGNKIITTSGGGMLVSADKALIDHARKLSTQARDPAPHYQHSEIGYNYRMSNVLAAIGRGQLRVLAERVRRKREIYETYRQALGDLPGLNFSPKRHGAVARAGLPASPWIQLNSAPTARRFVWRWKTKTSSRGRCGSRCTCSRCSRSARSWAAP
jgi:dTDP-4-amino-4,6-dideoxygalactose transaminase